jgi:uncharacterized protein YciU (UPF0263 family)
MDNMTVDHSPTSIFFELPQTGDEKAKHLLNAKLELIANIFKIRGMAGFVPSGDDFDALIDLDIDLLHQEVIRSEDWVDNIRRISKMA